MQHKPFATTFEETSNISFVICISYIIYGLIFLRVNEGEESAFVGMVSAVDKDIKENANISYSLPGDSLFNIHPLR
jgi:hypothetical protein